MDILIKILVGAGALFILLLVCRGLYLLYLLNLPPTTFAKMYKIIDSFVEYVIVGRESGEILISGAKQKFDILEFCNKEHGVMAFGVSDDGLVVIIGRYNRCRPTLLFFKDDVLIGIRQANYKQDMKEEGISMFKKESDIILRGMSAWINVLPQNLFNIK